MISLKFTRGLFTWATAPAFFIRIITKFNIYKTQNKFNGNSYRENTNQINSKKKEANTNNIDKNRATLQLSYQRKSSIYPTQAFWLGQTRKRPNQILQLSKGVITPQ
uniref:Uncharacterized protein n=1 Tax=Nelumbo nucifera TaxID=4432 RepID=A0A822ZSZ9_NELNU|nr:TPA_asm: hypothetical protein HUJ06_017944 [Nelumbo nucifera]